MFKIQTYKLKINVEHDALNSHCSKFKKTIKTDNKDGGETD